MDVCTIIAKNYIAQARVLARSFARHHPDGRFWTLIIDDFSRRVDPDREPFRVLSPSDIDCEPFIHMAMRYTVLELSTAVKPWLLRHLMRETGSPITYLDPDIKIYSSLTPLDELAAAHGVVLIPHNSSPIPADDRRPSQVDIMIAGTYNLGYVSLAPTEEVDRLLDWWADRLLRDCRVDPHWGYFVDQRWFDLAPGFLSDVAIMRDPEYNVAYWNLHSRPLAWDGDTYFVDGRPLAFFHFSGFDPDRPLALSRYQDRVDVLENPALDQILGEYAAEVKSVGYDATHAWPYSYGSLGDGTEIDDALRALYDDFADDLNGGASSPFTLEGAAAFMGWVRQAAPGAPPGVNRMLARVYEDRADVRAAFPDLTGTDRDRLLRWVQEFGAREIPGLASAITSGPGQSASAAAPEAGPGPSRARAPRASSEPLRVDRWGVNVVGYFRSELGMGEAARQVIAALDAGGIATLPIHGQTIPLSRQGHPFETVDPEDAVFPVNLICMNADALPEFVSQVGTEFFAGRYSAGLWFWEVDRFPERWRDSFSLLEEVWAPTKHVAAALEPVATVPVHTVRIPVRRPAFEPRSRADLGLPEDEFVFLFSFDYLSVFARKNPLAVVEAFCSEFAPGEGARLVLKCINHEHDRAAHELVTQAVARHPDVLLLDHYMTPSDNNCLTALSDCYVSLHRAEGFGLGMAEAMLLGKPVIATGYSGNLDFMEPTNSLLVDHKLIPIGDGADPYPSDGQWADPDIVHASSLMRRLFDDPAGARELGAKGAADVARTHSPRAAADVLGRRLESIRATGRARLSADHGRALPPALSALPMRIRQGPVQTTPQGGASARRLARNSALRAMRPYTAYQQTVNAQIVEALTELNDSIAEIRLQRAADHSRWLNELRINRGGPSDVQESGIDQIKKMLTLQTDRALYLAISEMQRRHAAISPTAGEPAPMGDLSGFELRAFSQNGEDGALAEILRRIGAPQRYFVEFGVESGREGNCVYLADVAGWAGTFMEADDDLFGALAGKYAGQDRVGTVQTMVTADNVEHVFAQAGIPTEPDVLSVDVDGQDYWIWEAIESYRPRVIVVEYNSALDPRRRLVQPNEPDRQWGGSEFFGASLGALRSLAQQKGYRFVHTELSGVNAFFVRADLAGDAFPDPADVAMRGRPNYFQAGYHHPQAMRGWRYLDLDTGQLVDITAEQGGSPDQPTAASDGISGS